jgi:glycosyltransferase involved in cell wall biosynthesis
MTTPTLSILMCTMNGAAHLREQLASIDQQEFSNWTLHVSDDGSTDDTQTMLERFRDCHAGRVHLRTGPRAGFLKNFLSLACDTSIVSDYYAFSDQDDVWDADKLKVAIDVLAGRSSSVPAMYGSRTRLIDEQGRHIGYSPLFPLRPSFRNALVQSLAGGNTMVFNRAAKNVLARAGARPVASHDWWLYLATTAVGGTVDYDRKPHIGYRVHNENLVGANDSWQARARRIRLLLKGQLWEWTNMHMLALEELRPRMTPENKKIFEIFAAARDGNVLTRPIGFGRAGIYRQTVLGNIGLIGAAFFDKI